MKPIRQARVLSRDGRGVVLDCGDDITMRIVALDEDLVRVTALRGGAVRQKRTWCVPARGDMDVDWAGRRRLDDSSWPAAGVGVEVSLQTVSIVTHALRLTISLDGLRMDWALSDGVIFARDRETQPYAFGQNSYAFRHAMGRSPADRHFGLGDKTGPLDLSGRRLRCAMRDALGFDPERGDPLYKNWPFLLVRDNASGVSYGIFYDNGAEGCFDLGCEHDNYFGLYRTYEAEDGDLDFYLLLGPRLKDVTPKFVALTGRTALPPRWSLGFAQTAMALADAPNAQARIEEVIDNSQRFETPISAFHLGSGYTSIGKKRYVFNWNRAKFPEPRALMAAFQDAGIHVVANLKPCLLDDHPRYAEVEAAGAFVASSRTGRPLKSQFWDGEGAHLDFTHRAGVAWWQESLKRQILDFGIEAGWNDNNEYGLWDDEATCAGFGEPAPLSLMRPTQALLMTRATREAQLAVNPGLRPFTVTRAGGPGLQRYAQTWSGDNTTSWRSLKWNLRTGLGMSLSGMYNVGHDVGGFAGPPPSPELLIRWTQAGVLHPRFLMNSWKDDQITTSPWLHPSALPAIREALRLRLRLTPYLYSLMKEAHATHSPILTPTFALFEDDPATFADADALMVGPWLMAAPVTCEGAREVEVYLPRGPESWRDFWTGDYLASGQSEKVSAPLERLPLFVAAGAVIATTDSGGDYSRLHDEPSRALLAFPGAGDGESSTTLYEDDGVTVAGETARVFVRLVWKPSRIRIAVSVAGDYPLPYNHIRVVLPQRESRPIELRGCERVTIHH